MKISNGKGIADYISVHVSEIYDQPRDVGGNLIAYHLVGTLPFGKDVVLKKFGIDQRDKAYSLLHEITNRFLTDTPYVIQ